MGGDEMREDGRRGDERKWVEMKLRRDEMRA
jgi:hypothetical protein